MQNYGFQTFEHLDLNLGVSFREIKLSQIVSSSSNLSFFYLLLADSLKLYSFVCTEQPGSLASATTSPFCEALCQIKSPTNITCATIHDQFIATIFGNDGSIIYLWTHDRSLMYSITLPKKENCTELKLSANGSYLFCVRPSSQKIALWRTKSLETYKDDKDILTGYISSDFIISLDLVGSFNPQSIVVDKKYPNLIFVNNLDSIPVLDLESYLWSFNKKYPRRLVRLVTKISLVEDSTSLSQPPNFDFLINKESILVFLLCL